MAFNAWFAEFKFTCPGYFSFSSRSLQNLSDATIVCRSLCQSSVSLPVWPQRPHKDAQKKRGGSSRSRGGNLIWNKIPFFFTFLYVLEIWDFYSQICCCLVYLFKNNYIVKLGTCETLYDVKEICIIYTHAHTYMDTLTQATNFLQDGKVSTFCIFIKHCTCPGLWAVLSNNNNKS